MGRAEGEGPSVGRGAKSGGLGQSVQGLKTVLADRVLLMSGAGGRQVPPAFRSIKEQKEFGLS